MVYLGLFYFVTDFIFPCSGRGVGAVTDPVPPDVAASALHGGGLEAELQLWGEKLGNWECFATSELGQRPAGSLWHRHFHLKTPHSRPLTSEMQN